MDIRFYNSLTHRLEDFAPIEAGHVYIYNCGPTVYDFAHIGNFRSFLFADLLRRFLEFSGLAVHQVMNITDVGHMTDDASADGSGEDKMQVAARRLKEAKKSGQAPVDDPNDPYQVAGYYAKAFIEDARRLNLRIVGDDPRQMPRATQYVQQMQEMIAGLIENKHAYVADDGAVYYSVESFPDYGQLSGNTLDKIRGGAGGRILDEHQAVKRHPADFLLWKPDPSHIMKWDSPWGAGYPGWHIECSAMAASVLGRQVIDIHTGGEDNIFPHHECEIAQSRGCFGHDHFARFWMHARYLMVEGQKMSKSKGNFYTVRDLVSQGVAPAVIRYEILKGHYRSNINFTRRGLEDSARVVQRLRDAAGEWKSKAGSASLPKVDVSHPVLAEFGATLADDLNIAGALAVVFKWLAEPQPDPATSLAVLEKIDTVLGVVHLADEQSQTAPAGRLTDDQAADLARQIDAARAAKDFGKADTLRKQIMDGGFEVRSTKEGTTVRRKLA